MEKITVLGHTNQDTDATAAAMAVTELLNATGRYRAKALINDKPNRETEMVLKKFGFKKPGNGKPKAGEKVFLVDFNEEEQSPIAFAKLDIEGLVDHHKLNIHLKKEYPIFFRVEPLGSSCSIVAKMFHDQDIAIGKKTAGLLLAGVISDTLKFSSPTTTKEDKKIAQELAKIAGVDIEALATEMFRVKSDLAGIAPKKIITTDYKKFKFGPYKTGIGVLETVDAVGALKLEIKLRKALSEHKKKEKLDLIFLGVVDILGGNTDLILIGREEEEVAQKVFPKAQLKEGMMHLAGVVSRKKQIVPEFEKKLK